MENNNNGNAIWAFDGFWIAKKMKTLKIILILWFVILWVFVARFSLLIGYAYGERELKKDVYADLISMDDCIIKTRFSSGGIDLGTYWNISDIMLHQDWEKNKDRRCSREVGEKIKEMTDKYSK